MTLTSSTLSGGASDNDYGYIVGSDHYPDIFVGRFSAENTSHVQTQVLRTLNYEKMPDAAPGYYQRAMCIASAEGTGDDGEYDWEHQRNIRTKYMNYTYTYGAGGYEMTDTWTIFGDPSLMVRTATPAAMTVTFPGDLPVGSDQITVYCDQEGARVAVSKNYQLLGSGIVSSGSANVFFGQVNTEDTLIVTVTAFNCLPVIDTVFITDLEMVYVSSTAFHGNLDEVAPGEQNVEVLGVKVIMSGSQNPFDLLSLTFNMNGTTNLSDVTSLRVYYTGNNAAFSANTLFGTGAVSAGAVTITGTQTLTGGFNHFWLAYDIDPAAIPGNHLDAGCSEVIFAGVTGSQVPSVTHPAGYRQVALDYSIPTYTYWLGHTNEWNNPANWSDGTVPGPDSHVIIPEILMGDHYPAVFGGSNPVIDLLELEPGSNLNVPNGITITIGNNR